jgi:hypothetical protein
MHTTYQGMTHSARVAGSHPRGGLTDPAVIDAYVQHRIEDPSLLSRRAEVRYADFFSSTAA